ncbi:MAG: hypothetical protein K1X42_18095 [Opitutaceae bacterium]|nr:hypothetical protein [Opitutaceae bacterium]
MDSRLKAKIEKAQDEWRPTLLCYQAGRLPGGSPVAKALQGWPDDYREFMALTDGPVCGCVTFFRLGELEKHQFMASMMSAEQGTWTCIGSVLNNPLFLEKDEGLVATANQDDGTIVGYGTLAKFLDEWVFGPAYERIVPGYARRDEWHEYLATLGFGK